MFVWFQLNVVLRVENLGDAIYLVVREETRCPDQPARQTSGKHVLCDADVHRKSPNRVCYTVKWSKAINPRSVNLHIVEHGPSFKPYPLQISNNKLEVAKGHLDGEYLI